MRDFAFDHLQHAVQDTDHRAEGPILALGEAAQAVEVPKQLVGAVDEVDDHAVPFPSTYTKVVARSSPRLPGDPLVQAQLTHVQWPHGPLARSLHPKTMGITDAETTASCDCGR